MSYRIGDMVAPALPESEALRAVMEEFAASITRAAAPRSPTAAPGSACSPARVRRREHAEGGAFVPVLDALAPDRSPSSTEAAS